MEVIYTEPPYEILAESRPTEEMVTLLEKTRWGTGKTVYQHFHNREHLFHIHHPRIFTVRENGALRAFIVFAQRQLPGFPNQGKAYYIRFFCASPEIKGKGIVKDLSGLVMDWIRAKEEQVCFYATIEAKNPAVGNIISSVGFQVLTTVRTLGFSRLFPKDKLQVHKLDPDQWTAFLPALESHYAQHAFWMKDNLYLNGEYFVHEKEGQVLAGVQVHRGKWAIHHLPGLAEKILLPILPYLPYINKIFNPKAFYFLTFEGFYAVPGYENLLPDLIESLLHRFKIHSAILWLDEKDPLYEVLRNAHLGVLNAFVHSSTARFIGSFHQYPEEKVKELQKRVAYVSTYDFI